MPPRTDEQIADSIRANSARGLRVLGEAYPPHDRLAVVVCYGPSLTYTWEGIRDEGGDIWTTSGAHAFLVTRGIHVFGHTDVDPRPHKARVLTALDFRTHFYIPSRVHPDYMARMVLVQNKTLYHVGVPAEERVLEEVAPGRPRVPCAITAGLCLVQLLLHLGYRRFVIYGMDGSAPEGTAKHAGDHPNKAEPFDSEVEIGGRCFHTNMLMLNALEDFFAIATQYPMGTFQFRGWGMIPWAEECSRKGGTRPPPRASNE